MKLERFGYTDKDMAGLIIDKKSTTLGLPIIDTVSAKALSIPDIQAEWIED